MRKLVLPLLVCGAIGALIVLLAQRDDERPPERPDEPAPPPVKKAERKPVKPVLPPPAKTTTSLSEHKWMREFERALQRKDLSKAYWYRGKVCGDMEKILANEKLAKNLLTLIREQGIESDDPGKRDVLLPILRVLKHEDATEMIRELYYSAQSRAEQMVLLEAMSHSYHDPAQAAVWGVDMALNGESEQERRWGYDCLENYCRDDEVAIQAAYQIYQATTRPEQSLRMLGMIAKRASLTDTARQIVRTRLKNPTMDELSVLLNHVEGGWMTEDDAAQLEVLAREFPAVSEILHDRARAVRRELRLIEEQKRENEERKRREAAKGDKNN